MDTKTSHTPYDIESSGDQIFDISYHPYDNFIAIATITGIVEVYKYGDQSINNQLINKFAPHTSSCRGVKFSQDGNTLITISSDKSWKCIDGTGRIVNCCEQAHDEPINRISLLHTMPTCFVTADDIGNIKLWDTRISYSNNTNNGQSTSTTAAVMSWQVHNDYISDLLYIPDTNTLFSTAGDSTLCTYDIRKKTVYEQSDEQESELTCIQNIKHNKKLCVGTQDGVILMFSWAKWGDCSDRYVYVYYTLVYTHCICYTTHPISLIRSNIHPIYTYTPYTHRYPGHPETVDCMLKIDESMLLTGSSDGLIRVVSIQPNKILGVVGDHDDFPVEGVCSVV